MGARKRTETAAPQGDFQPLGEVVQRKCETIPVTMTDPAIIEHATFVLELCRAKKLGRRDVLLTRNDDGSVKVVVL